VIEPIYRVSRPGLRGLQLPTLHNSGVMNGLAWPRDDAQGRDDWICKARQAGIGGGGALLCR